MSTALQAQIVRGMRQALRIAGIDLAFVELPFRAIENPVEPPKDGVRLNTADVTACTLDALAEDFTGTLPDQSDSFTAAATGLRYRITRREWVRGQPVVRFHCTTSPL